MRMIPQDYQDDWEAFCAACQEQGIPLFVLTQEVPPADLSILWTVDEAEQFGAVPAGLEDNQLTVAMTDPRDSELVAALETRTGYQIFPVLAHVNDVSAAIQRMTNFAAGV